MSKSRVEVKMVEQNQQRYYRLNVVWGNYSNIHKNSNKLKEKNSSPSKIHNR